MRSSRPSRAIVRTPTAIKVPAIGPLFWTIKILTTGMGEACSDYLAAVSIPLAVGIALIGMALAFWLEFRATRYSPGRYWFTVAMVAVFGTMMADGVHLVGIPYLASTALYIAVVATMFALWRRSEGTLSVHSIFTTRREIFYWVTVLATFALGTAAGDLVAGPLGFGYLSAGILFAVLILIPLIGWRSGRLNPVIAFWSAYVLTRPLGASFADWFGKPAGRSGLGLGDGPVTVVMIVIITLLVGLLIFRNARQVGSHTSTMADLSVRFEPAEH